MSQFFVPRGTQDIFGKDIKKWHKVENLVRDLCARYHVEEMRTPMYEHTEVFARKDDASDVVNKEMLNFLNPDYALISTGMNNYGHPNGITLDILKSKGVKILRTDRQNAIKMSPEKIQSFDKKSGWIDIK